MASPKQHGTAVRSAETSYYQLFEMLTRPAPPASVTSAFSIALSESSQLNADS